ncbi:MAG: hypothetical protein SFT90_07450 [Rickettsiales bacterium]|nr:hypothetical protein [Rickettsiales bacterium]
MNKISLFLTEPIGYPNKADTNLLIKESVSRLDTYAFTPEDLIFENLPEVKLFANCNKVSLDASGNLQASQEKTKIEINKKTIVTIRLNPPFDSRYYTAMKLLEYKEGEALIFNSPKAIASMPEKLVSSELLPFMPKTIITSNIEEIKDFWKENQDIIIKPIYEFGGRGVFKLKKEDENHLSIFNILTEKYKEPLIAQIYLPEVKKGDKRILLFDGEFVGCHNRIAPEGVIQVATQGAEYFKSSLTETEVEFCKILGKICKENNILICGLDSIGGFLTEVNITCPAGFACVNEFFETNIQKLYWDKISNLV